MYYVAHEATTTGGGGLDYYHQVPGTTSRLLPVPDTVLPKLE